MRCALSIADELKIVASQSAGEGTYVVPIEAFFEFLENSSLSTVNYLNFFDGNIKDQIIYTVAEMPLFAYTQLSLLQAERATDNSPFVHIVPPTLPAQIYACNPVKFLRLYCLKSVVLKIHVAPITLSILRTSFVTLSGMWPRVRRRNKSCRNMKAVL